MKSIGKCLSEKYVLNGIIESHFSMHMLIFLTTCLISYYTIYHY